MYTIGYMMAPELWKYEHKPSEKKIVLPDRVPEEVHPGESDQIVGQMNIMDFLTA